MLEARLEQALDSLNPEQREAVGCTEGPLLVLAGAGSGKTRVITVRTAQLVARGVEPEHILCVTFTNKAAAEMRERIGTLVGEPSARLSIGTFHAYCMALLRENSERLGLGRRFALLDEADQTSAVKQALREQRIAEAELRPRDVLGRISLAKSRGQDPEVFLAGAADDREERIGRVWRAYAAWQRRSRALDFDDLLLETLRLFREHPEVLAEQRTRRRYVQVDEYQDTNTPQYDILRHLAGASGNLCAVGDDDQSIYGWRGADVGKILNFERDFPGAKVVRLETNYRSTPEILTAANAVIANNPLRHGKTLRAALPSGEPVTAFVAEDEVQEADQVARTILSAVQGRQAALRDFAVLFRTATQPKVFEAQFRQRGLPYVLIGGMSFFDRKEVKDVLGYLRLALDPGDETAFLRVVERPPRGVGRTSIERALEHATAEGLSVLDVFGEHAAEAGVSGGAARAVEGLMATLAEWGENTSGGDLGARLEELVERVGYRSEVDRTYPDDTTREARWKAVEDLIDMARNHQRRRKRPSLERFLDELSLESADRPETEGEARDVVTLMTLHAAKGLEFRRVFLVGLEEGVLPHGRAVAEDGVEEERRLCYVGITRAQERLVLSWCAQRNRGGGRSLCHPSRFVFEIKGQPPPADWCPAGSEAQGAGAPPGKARGAARGAKGKAKGRPGTSRRRTRRP